MKSLDHYFTAARSHQQAIPFAEIATLLDAAPTAAVEHDSMSHPSSTIIAKKIMISLTISLTLVAAGIGVLELATPAEHTQPTPQIASSGAPSIPAISSAPAEVQQYVQNTTPKVQTTSASQQSDAYTHYPVTPPAPITQKDEKKDASDGLKNRDGDTPKNGDGPKSDASVDISGANLIELGTLDLARLGIKPDSTGVWVMTENDGSPLALHVSMGGMQFSQDATVTEVTPLPSVPPLITDDRGTRRMFSYDDAEVDPELAGRIKALPENSPERAELQLEMSRKAALKVETNLNSLIPILVKTGRSYTIADSLAKRWRPDCIIWLRPTSEVIARFPEPIRSRIEREVAAVRSMTTADGTVMPNITGEKPYLDIFRTTSGAVGISTIFPNPARGRTALAYRVAEDRILTVSLHRIDGGLVRRLVEGRSVKRGEGSIDLDLEGMGPGIYLVAITTEKGEHTAQRLVIP